MATHVEILDRLTFTPSMAPSMMSVSLSSLGTYFANEKFNECHGSLKHYAVDRLRESWTVLAGYKPVDVQKERDSLTKTFLLYGQGVL